MPTSRAQSMVSADHIEVAAAVIRGKDGRLLLAQRPAGKHLAGLWEFPGGKCEPGEPVEVALARELAEELGIEVTRSQPLLSLTHRYPEKSVRLLIHTVDSWTGEARGCEGQRVAWFDLAQVRSLPMPPADRPILKLLDVDPRYSISPDASALQSSNSVSIDVHGKVSSDWQARLDAGFRLLCLSSGRLDHASLKLLAERCGALARTAGARWLLNGPADLARLLKADGVHLDVEQLRQIKQRPLSHDRLVAATCTSDDDLARAGDLALDFVCLESPESLAQDSPLRWRWLSDRIARSAVPVIVAGSVGPDDLARARGIGAFGVGGTRRFTDTGERS